jgi:phosphoribosylanthranilate isomerase
MWVKICGITRLQDALAAQALGASAIGFVFAPSPRQIDIVNAAEIAHFIKIAKVGVFVDSSPMIIQNAVERCHLDIIQLHGNETAEFCSTMHGRSIKAFRFKDETVLCEMKKYSGLWKLLLDAYSPGKMGGTGVTINHNLLHRIDNFCDIILAGGIHEENVRDFLAYNPFGLDVSSGVESEPGIKDSKKMENLFNIIKEYNR